jgi:hypothetical protein
MDQIPDFLTHLLVKCRPAILPSWTTDRLNSHASVKREQGLRESCWELTEYYIITRVAKTRSQQHSSKFEPVQSWRDCMSVTENRRSNTSQTCNVLRISSSINRRFKLFNVAQYSLYKMENLQYLDPYFLRIIYYLLKNNMYLNDVKHYLKAMNFPTKVAQLSLLWQNDVSKCHIFCL